MITDINQLQLTQNSTSSFKFFYTPFFDKSIYHITVTATCINENEVNQYSDHTFYHQFEEVNYKITCCLISPKVIYEHIFFINCINDYSFFYFNLVRLFLYFNHVYLIKR